MSRAHERSAAEPPYQDVRAEVARSGWAVHCVEGPTRYAYTVGLTALGLPELVVTGLPPDRAASLLDAAARRARAGGGSNTLGGVALRTVPLSRPHAALPVAVAVCGAGVRALRLSWDDTGARWPWHPVFRRRRRAGRPAPGPRRSPADPHRPRDTVSRPRP